MLQGKRILVLIGCITLLLISWIVAINSKSDEEKQLILLERATELISNGIFIHAAPLLEEAVVFKTDYTVAIEDELKRVYLALIETRGYRRKYVNLLEEQMNRANADPYVFAEAANYYLGISRIPEALAMLRDGIDRTGDVDLMSIYELHRYSYETNRKVYEDVTAIYGETVQVQIDGLWGLAHSNGIMLIPCLYDKISTFSIDRAIVLHEEEIYAINTDGNRIALLHEPAVDFGNYADNRIPILLDTGWRRATGEFEIGTASFEQIGMYSDGYAAAKVDGKWGVIDLALNWLIPPEFDEIKQDELGRCYSGGAVFARLDRKVYLFVDGQWMSETYDDARPFCGDGYAAVKRNGFWGFIDRTGTVRIGYRFHDALSFGQHLAAISQGELWGYINISGTIVIEPVFHNARSFSNGSAPVQTDNGWQFITLIEYRKGPNL